CCCRSYNCSDTRNSASRQANNSAPRDGPGREELFPNCSRGDGRGRSETDFRSGTGQIFLDRGWSCVYRDGCIISNKGLGGCGPQPRGLIRRGNGGSGWLPGGEGVSRSGGVKPAQAAIVFGVYSRSPFASVRRCAMVRVPSTRWPSREGAFTLIELLV